MAMAAAKLPIICRSCVGILRKNGVGWDWFRGLHGLPQDGSVSYLRNSVNGAEVYMLGTCHIGAKSAQLVKEASNTFLFTSDTVFTLPETRELIVVVRDDRGSKVIDFVNPNIIAIELCQRRLQSYQQAKPYQQSFSKILLNSLRFPGTRHAKMVQFFRQFLYHMLHILGFDPGKEFKIALEECKRLETQFLLIDQDSEVTARKLAEVSSSRQILSTEDVKVLQQLVATIKIKDLLKGRIQMEELLEIMTQRNFVRKVTENMTRVTPDIARVIFTERDQIMFDNLRKCEGKIVAVVGMAHMDGIERMWNNIEHKLCE